MLTIRAMTGGEGYGQRHLQPSDYYDQNRTVEGRWHGRGAELLGLKGEVTSEDFEAVRQGLDPQTGEFLRQRHEADRIASNGEEQSRARSPANYHEFTHGYAVTAHRSLGKTVDTVILSADAMKTELFYVAANRGRSEIVIITSDREQLRESVGVSTMRQSAIELARKQLTAHNVEKGHHGVDLVTDVNRQAGQQIGEQHSSVPTHAPEPERTPHVGLDHDLGGLGLGLGR